MLQIRKKTDDIWEHIDTVTGRQFILSDFYVESEVTDGFQIKEIGGSQRVLYTIANVTVYDDTDGGAPETFANQVDLFARLFALTYPAFDYTEAISALYQTKANLSTGVVADQASDTKYPSVKAVFDWVTSAISTANNWLKTGNNIRNTNTENVQVKLVDGFEFQVLNNANTKTAYIGHQGFALFSQVAVPTITGGLGGLPFINVASTGGVDGTWETSQIYYDADHSADTSARRLVDRGEMDPSAIIYDDNRHGNSLDMSNNSISGVSSLDAVTATVSTAPAVPTDVARLQEITDLQEEYPTTAYAQTITYNAGTAPSGTFTASWQASRSGKHITARLNFKHSVAGATVTVAMIPWPTGLPIPADISGWDGNNDFFGSGYGYFQTGTTSSGVASRVGIRKVSTGVFELYLTGTSGSHSGGVINFEYWIP